MGNKITEVLLLILAVTVIYTRYQAVKIPMPKSDIPYTFSAQLLQLPKTHGNYQTFKLGQVFVTTRYPPTFQYGDLLSVEGTLTTEMKMKYPIIQKTDNGIQKGGTKTEVRSQKSPLTSLSSLLSSVFSPLTSPIEIQARLLDFRGRLSSQIGRYLPSPQAELISGVLWGEKANLPKSFSEALKTTGVMHMVVVSGYNISVIAALMLSAFAVLGRKTSALATVLGIVIFTLLTGAEAPSVRAAIMGGLMVLGQLIGRERTALRLLIVSAVVMLIVNPLWAEDLGFQLSFLATLGILVFAGQSEKTDVRIQKGVTKAENGRGKSLFAHLSSLPSSVIRFLTSQTELRTTLAAQVLTWPLIASAFGTVSLISPVTNLLIGWTVPLLMAFGALLTVAAAVSSLLARLISLVLLVPATFFVEVVNILAQVPGAVVDVKIGPEVLIGYYLGVLALFVLGSRLRGNDRFKGGVWDDRVKG